MPVIIFAFAAALLCSVSSVLFFHYLCWQGVLLFLGIFIGVQVLFALTLVVISLFVDTSKPLEKPHPVFRRSCCLVASFVLFYFHVRTRISGEERIPQEGRFLFICNHRSGFDPLVAFSCFYRYNLAFISKQENMALPVWGKIGYGAGCLAIDRDNDRKALKTILEAAEYISNDICSMGVYPEGTRSKTGEVLPFRAGCFKIAQKARIPVVIAATHGSEHITKNFPFKRTDVYIDILDTVPAETVCSLSTRELSDYARDKIEQFLSGQGENESCG